jgi:hypothetical protein
MTPHRCTNCRYGRYNGFLTSFCALTKRVHSAGYCCLYYGRRKNNTTTNP